MEQRKILESALERLKELDRRLSDDEPEEVEVMEELNNILNGLKVMQLDVVKSSINPVLKFVNESPNPDPTFAHEGDSGFDIRANLKDDYIIYEGHIGIIPTGLYFEVEKGLEIQIRPRSGLAANFGITIVNTPGTVDSHYRGEIKIILVNLGKQPFVIKNGDRIAQGVVCPVYGEGRLNLQKVENLSESGRGANGLGSSGVK